MSLNLNLKTPLDQINKTEQNKLEKGLAGDLHEEFRNRQADISWEAEQIAKSHGIYLEFNRATKGKEKDWIYMIRIGLPGGTPISPAQWQLLDNLASKFAVHPNGYPSLRLTTRQAIQFHWVKKEGVVEIVRQAAKSGLFSLNACGDNVRNVLACPLSNLQEHFNGTELAREIAAYFRLPTEPFIQVWEVDPHPDLNPETERYDYGPSLLNRKFKIAVGSILKNEKGDFIQDNCVELRTNDLGLAPIHHDGEVTHFQVYIGGGQGEKNGKPTASLLGEPLAVVANDQVLAVTKAVVDTHKEWGDRENRHWARLKYVVRQQGIRWFREQVQEKINFKLEPPIDNFDVGSRHLHHGWFEQSNGLWAFGMFVENGRLTDDSPNGRLKTMVGSVIEQYQTPVLLTPNQDIIFQDIPQAKKESFEGSLQRFGYGERNGEPYSHLRRLSGACVGRDTCRLTYTDSEQFEPELIDTLEEKGFGHIATSIGITGCERQCFRPATKAIGLVGSGLNRYLFKFFGTEDAKHQGVPLIWEEQNYLQSVPRERVAQVIEILFAWFDEERLPMESFGYFLLRQGPQRLLAHLQKQQSIADLLSKPKKVKGLII